MLRTTTYRWAAIAGSATLLATTTTPGGNGAPSTTEGPDAPGGPATTAPSGAGGGSGAAGQLPNTGSDAAPLAATGLALTALGAAAGHTARRLRRSRGQA